jgi:transposase
MKEQRNYPSEISREQFEQIRELLESVRKKTRPSTVDLYDIFCGVLYVLKSGCQWRMLPNDYPKWRTVYEYYRKWGEIKGENQTSCLEQVLKKIGWSGPHQTWAERTDQFLYH